MQKHLLNSLTQLSQQMINCTRDGNRQLTKHHDGCSSSNTAHLIVDVRFIMMLGSSAAVTSSKRAEGTLVSQAEGHIAAIQHAEQLLPA